MFTKLKQFQDLKNRAKQMQHTLEQETAEGSAGWGKVKIVMDGNQHVRSVTIDPEAMQDRTKLQEYIREATNDAVTKIQKIMAGKLKDMGGLDLAKEFGDALKK